MNSQYTLPVSHFQRICKCFSDKAGCILVITLLAISSPAIGTAQDILSGNELVSKSEKVTVNSGQIFHDGEAEKVVWQETVTVNDAEWIRLNFKQLVLAGNPLGGPSSTLRVTSLTDNAVQLLNAETAQQWRNTSAYFNGNAVKLELIAAPNNRMNLIVVDDVTAGQVPPPDVTETICDDVDDRILSNDPRAGRTAPGGCSAWLFNDRANCMLTAGHCAPSTEVILFNVPLSNSNGGMQFPGPEDQYAVDFQSFQSVNGGVGNDWGYFGVFPNSTTGLTAFEAQGDSFLLADPPPLQDGDMIRITGYGSTSFPVDPTWNSAQKTQVGPFAAVTQNQLGYRTDTTGGNSGSPVIFEATGEAIGIHTHGGCGSGGGMNLGTASTQFGFANALANPLGICQLPVDFDFLTSLPQIVSPQGGDILVVTIDHPDFDLVDTTATLHIDSGAGFQTIPLEPIGDDTFQATFPTITCGTILNYFFSIEASDGEQFTNPVNASSLNSYVAVSADAIAIEFEDDFDTNLGWNVSGSAIDGQWQRGIPAGGGDRGDPPADADGSGFCFVTDNEDGNSDVDGGVTILTSPVFDATINENQNAIVSYFRWFNNGTEGDQFRIEVSNNAGASWTTVELLGNGNESNGGWFLNVFSVAEFITPTNQTQIRFSVSDLGDPSVVEAGVDAFSISIVDCADVLLGDTNLDGVVSLLDVSPFVDLINTGDFQSEADIDGNGVVNLLDVQLFIEILNGN